MMTCNERCRRAILEPALETRKLQMKTIVEDMKGMEVCSIAFSWQKLCSLWLCRRSLLPWLSVQILKPCSHDLFQLAESSKNVLIFVDTCCVIYWHQTGFPTAQVSLFCSACFYIEFWNLHYRAAEAGYWLWLQPRGGGLQVPGVMEYLQGFPSQVSIASDTIWKRNAVLATVCIL